MLTVRRPVALRRERQAAEHIPYTSHVSENIVKTGSGDYVQGFRLGGTSFESADDEQLNSWHERLNVLWRNLATPSLALWTHVVRRPERASIRPTSGGGFADTLTAGYHERLAAETLMVNELYLALCYRPTGRRGAGAIARLLARTKALPRDIELADALDNCAKVAQTVAASLARYEPEPLGTYRRDSVWHSSLLEYLALLVNGEWRPVPLRTGPVSAALATTRVLFGSEAIEYRLPAATRVGAVLGIKEYPTPSVVGMFNRLLSAPFAFVLTQSFTFLSRAAGQALLQRQFFRMENAGDFSQEIAERYGVAVDLAVHAPRAGSDPRNFHAHLLTTTREVTPAGLGAKAGIDMTPLERRRRELPDHRSEYLTLRERWAALTNLALREANLSVRVDHRSLAAQGIDREPQPRIPLMQLKMEQRGVRSEVAERLRQEYRQRVSQRLAHSPAANVAEPVRGEPAVTISPPSTSPRTSVKPWDIEEIRRQAREAWLLYKSREAAKNPDASRGSATAAARASVEERDTPAPDVPRKDDLAL